MKKPQLPAMIDTAPDNMDHVDFWARQHINDILEYLDQIESFIRTTMTTKSALDKHAATFPPDEGYPTGEKQVEEAFTRGQEAAMHGISPPLEEKIKGLLNKAKLEERKLVLSEIGEVQVHYLKDIFVYKDLRQKTLKRIEELEK